MASNINDAYVKRTAQKFEKDTWLQDESAAYPAGGQTRMGRAMFPDQKTRRVWAGIHDTFFSVPAHATVGKQYMAGWLSVDDDGVLYFNPSLKAGEGMSVNLDEVENPFVKARLEELAQHSIVIRKAEFSPNDPGLLLLHLKQSDADQWGIHHVLGINTAGRIAEEIVTKPYYYMTFSMLMTAANTRTAIT